MFSKFNLIFSAYGCCAEVQLMCVCVCRSHCGCSAQTITVPVRRCSFISFLPICVTSVPACLGRSHTATPDGAAEVTDAGFSPFWGPETHGTVPAGRESEEGRSSGVQAAPRCCVPLWPLHRVHTLVSFL